MKLGNTIPISRGRERERDESGAEYDPANLDTGGSECLIPLHSRGGSPQPWPDDAAPRGGHPLVLPVRVPPPGLHPLAPELFPPAPVQSPRALLQRGPRAPPYDHHRPNHRGHRPTRFERSHGGPETGPGPPAAWLPRAAAAAVVGR